MIISGINISTFGLTLLSLTGFLDLPKRKDITGVPFFTANDIKFKAITPTVVLYGRWASVAAMETALNSFQALIKTAVKHTIAIEEYGISGMGECIFKDGYEVEFMGSVAKITAKITVTGAIEFFEPSVLPVIETLPVANISYGSTSCECDFNMSLTEHGTGGTTIDWGWDYGYATDNLQFGITHSWQLWMSFGILTELDHDYNLPPDTDIFIRAKATNPAGTAYGEILTFHTPAS